MPPKIPCHICTIFVYVVLLLKMNEGLNLDCHENYLANKSAKNVFMPV